MDQISIIVTLDHSERFPRSRYAEHGAHCRLLLYETKDDVTACIRRVLYPNLYSTGGRLTSPILWIKTIIPTGDFCRRSVKLIKQNPQDAVGNIIAENCGCGRYLLQFNYWCRPHEGNEGDPHTTKALLRVIEGLISL